MKKTLLIRWAVIVLLLLNVSAQAAHDKHLVPTPPMGWNSWNCVGYDVTEELVCGIADAIVESGMKDAGYTYVVIDDVWHKGRVDFKTFDAKGNQIPAGKNVPGRDANGTLIADPNKFPRGIAFVADYVHARGLKFGLYTVPGTRTCAGCSGVRIKEGIFALTCTTPTRNHVANPNTRKTRIETSPRIGVRSHTTILPSIQIPT